LCSKNYPNVNYTLFTNKDGKYSWRPLQLINPILYVLLVNEITSKDNWDKITKKFKEFYNNEKIKSFDIPKESIDIKNNDKKSTIIEWWEEIEQESIKLSLKYNCILKTDITDCYGSIYTHTIPWAIHGEKEEKERILKERIKDKINDKDIGNEIDDLLISMNYGQTNGIPQGSELMNFIAEIVLGYADMLLSEKIKNITDYQILRYRDDYRIFTKNKQDAEFILKILSEVLAHLNFKLNEKKTIFSENIIENSIKPDKLYYINNRITAFATLQQELLYIHSISLKFPNSGTIKKLLNIFYNKISNNEKKEYKEDINILISIIVDIILKNPIIIPQAMRIISFFIKQANDIDSLINDIKQKFAQMPNNILLNIWLQRLLLSINSKINLNDELCKIVLDDSIQLFNNDWLKEEYKSGERIIDKEKLKNLSMIFDDNEVISFNERYYFY
jgi:RNA-directed DNA polymerase